MGNKDPLGGIFSAGALLTKMAIFKMAAAEKWNSVKNGIHLTPSPYNAKIMG